MTTTGQNLIYINCDLTNDTNEIIPATIKFNSSQPVLDQKKNYDMTVLRMAIPLLNVPIFYYNPTPNYYLITVGDSKVDGSFNCPYIDESSFNVPVDPNAKYAYSVFEIQYWLDSVNYAISQAYAAYIANGGTITKTRPPFIAYDQVTTLFRMYFTQDWLLNDLNLYFNTNVFLFFYGLKSIFNGTPGNKNFQIPFYQQYTGANPNIIASGFIWPVITAPAIPYIPQTAVGTSQTNVWYMTTEEPNLNEWYDVSKILLVSDDLPTRKELIIPSKASNQANNSSSISIGIITDFQLDDYAANAIKSTLVYNPTAEFRRITCSNSNLTNFTIKVFLQYKDGNIRQMDIPPLSSINVKLLFEELN